jgi:NAD(P)-dependent dehydrogenase (short-subunit alcohol dehydrogenase family)
MGLLHRGRTRLPAAASGNPRVQASQELVPSAVERKDADRDPIDGGNDLSEKQEGGQPPQQQGRQPGRQGQMAPEPDDSRPEYRGSGKLDGKVALITGGDSGIGRSVAVLFAREGADVAVVYLEEHDDADETVKLVESEGRRAIKIAGDVGDEAFCRSCVERTVAELGQLDILVNNAAEQHEVEDIAELPSEQLHKTFRTNIFSQFYLSKAAVPQLKERKGCIINSTSVTAYKGKPSLLDYSSTKGAILAFTRSLALQLAEDGVRVNAVAPGPIWTPLIPASFPPEKVEEFGTDTPMGRPGQPEEVAPSYVFLASDVDSSYITGQVLHPNGGQVVNG